MEEYYYKRSNVPVFGSWDWNDNLPFTQCFESTRQVGLLHYGYSQSEERDLYVEGDLYENDVVTPAMIVVPRTRAKMQEKEAKKKNWVRNVNVVKPQCSTSLPMPTPKPVDEDLYKISPMFLYKRTKKKRGLCFFSSCLCIARNQEK